MTKQKHTPGPWESDAAMVWAPGAQKVVCQASDPSPLSGFVEHKTVAAGSPLLGEVFANARLIAAAPELLVALKDLLYQCRQLHGEETQCLDFDQAEAAIAKAEGVE